MTKKIQGIIDLVEDAIENGANSIEEVHMSIAEKPFELLKNIAPLEQAADSILNIQEQTIGNVYQTIRRINEEAANVARDMLAKTSK